MSFFSVFGGIFFVFSGLKAKNTKNTKKRFFLTFYSKSTVKTPYKIKKISVFTKNHFFVIFMSFWSKIVKNVKNMKLQFTISLKTPYNFYVIIDNTQNLRKWRNRRFHSFLTVFNRNRYYVPILSCLLNTKKSIFTCFWWNMCHNLAKTNLQESQGRLFPCLFWQISRIVNFVFLCKNRLFNVFYTKIDFFTILVILENIGLPVKGSAGCRSGFCGFWVYF